MPQENTGTGATHHFEIPLVKVDVERRLVIGTAAAEVPDKSGEIMDYASARPQFEKWSQEFVDATGGLSKGNLRIMHGKDVGGRFDDIAYDDANKQVQVVAKVVDDQAWEKVLSGCYTGFSIGGGYLKKWKDPESGLTRYTPIIREISLVDSPCMPCAKFAELVKADGIVEQLELKGVSHSFAEHWSARPRGFEEHWAQRPRTFAELGKNWHDYAVPAALGVGALGLTAAALYHAHQSSQDQKAREDAAEAGFRHSAANFFQHPDNSRVTDSEVNHHLLGALHAWQHHAAGNLDYAHAKNMADTHVAVLLGKANMRMKEEHGLDAQRAAGQLSEKEHAERIAAAKARWAQEGGGPHMHLTHYNEPAEKAATVGDLRKALSSNPLAGTIGEDDADDPDAAAAMRRTDRAAGGLPSKGAASTSVRRKLGLAAPATPAIGLAAPAMPAIEKLAKNATGVWSEDKHPRNRGRFASKDHAPSADQGGPSLGAVATSPAARAGFAAGAGVGGAAFDARDAIHDRLAFGGGEQGSRNRFAQFLRDPENGDIRHAMKLRTRASRLNAMGANTLEDRVNGARRKVAEEQFARGGGSMEGVQEAADQWTHKLLARADRKGGQAAVDTLKDEVGKGRAVLDRIKQAERQDVVSSIFDKKRIASQAAAGVVGGGIAAYLGTQSAKRLRDEAAGREVGTGEHVLATAGDVARFGSAVLGGKGIGSAAAGIGTALGQAWRPSLRHPFRFTLGRLRLGEIGENMTRGGHVGAALGAVAGARELVPEYAARLGGGGKKDSI